MRINHNISAMSTFTQLSKNEAAQSKTMNELSTGKRINSGADDAAGLAISERMKAQIRGLDQASRNSQDGISMIQTADGAMGQATDILQRMRELAVQASSDTNQSSDRTAIGNELDQLQKGLTDISNQTQFNGTKLLNGSVTTAVNIQTGANNGENMSISLSTSGVDLSAISAALSTIASSISTAAGAQSAIDTIQTQIDSISSGRSYLGAAQNRLEYTINNLDASSQNTSAAESRISDVDMAQAVMENSKNGILAQAAQAMLSQANQMPQNVLQLLR